MRGSTPHSDCLWISKSQRYNPPSCASLWQQPMILDQPEGDV
jgi:hypothetical protein